MLHEAQRTSAPSATSVSISTAVCTVMCSEPVIRAPASGWLSAYSRRVDISPGISCSASWISLRPNSASARSATLKSILAAVVLMGSPLSCVLSGYRQPPSGGGQQLLMLGLLEAQPVVVLDVVGPASLAGEPAGYGLAKLLIALDPRGERHVGEPELEPVEQLLQRPQALQLGRPVQAVARRGAPRADEPRALHVAEHSRRPAGRLRRLVDRQTVHWKSQPYHDRVKVSET